MSKEEEVSSFGEALFGKGEEVKCPKCDRLLGYRRELREQVMQGPINPFASITWGTQCPYCKSELLVKL